MQDFCERKLVNKTRSKKKQIFEVKSMQSVRAFLWSKCREDSGPKGFSQLDSDLGLVFVGEVILIVGNCLIVCDLDLPVLMKYKKNIFEVKSMQSVRAFLWSKCREDSGPKGFSQLDSDLGLVFVGEVILIVGNCLIVCDLDLPVLMKYKKNIFEVKSMQSVRAFLWSKCREDSGPKGFSQLDSDLGLVFVGEVILIVGYCLIVCDLDLPVLMKYL